MARGFALIAWDEFEGATLAFQFPPSVTMDDSVVQRIQIAHNFVESWMVTQEQHFNGISYYDPVHGYVIVLLLDQYEDGQDYRPIIEEINKYLIENPEEPSQEELEKIWELTFSVYKAREAVMLKLAQEVADLKLQHHEIKRNVEIISHFTRDSATKILLYVALNEPAYRDDIAAHVQVTERWLDHLLEDLQSQKQLGYREKDGAYYIP